MTIFKTWINYREEQPQMEVFTLPSLTQPDEVLTVREMLERHVRGLPIFQNQNGHYLPEELGYIPDYREMDLTEIDEYRDYYKQTIQRLSEQEPAPAVGTTDISAGDTRPAPQTEPPTPEPPNQPQA